jgi:hypothetical protein
MINDNVLKTIRYAVCAVGYLTVPLERLKESPAAANFHEIAGTGFLVRDSIVMTNRHVLIEINEECANSGIPEDQRVLQFVYPSATGWQTSYREFNFVTRMDYLDIDVAFIEFERPTNLEFQQCRPVGLAKDAKNIIVGKPIGLFGYADGTQLLVNETIDSSRVYRFGPILQQGYISAVAPYDGRMPISDILSDIRTMEGMSGSPVFYSDSGEVFAIHYASNQFTTSFSIPLYSSEVEEWLSAHDAKKRELQQLVDQQ